MRNILNGECYKWKKNKAFWICLLSAVGMILLVYLTMTAAGQAMGAGGDVLRETGISGMAEQFAGGGRDDVQRDFSLYLGNKRLYPWSNEECGGQGLFQSPGVFGKALVWNTDYHAHEFSHLPCDFDYRANTDRDTACREFVFSKSLYLFWTSAPISVAVSSIVIAVCEWSRNMAVEIRITMALIIFSPLLMQGLDLLFSAMQLKITISGYWILNLMADCPTEAFTSD